MDKIKINLIPPEIKERVKKEAKRSLIIRISIGLLGLLIVFTSGILAVTIIQNASLGNLNRQIDQDKSRINSLNQREAVVSFLKNRVDSINQFTGNRYQQGEVFELISSLFPNGVNLSTMQIDATSKILIQGDTESTVALQNFFDNLTDPTLNDGKIANVSVESLNRAANGRIRFDLSVNLKEGK